MTTPSISVTVSREEFSSNPKVHLGALADKASAAKINNSKVFVHISSTSTGDICLYVSPQKPSKTDATSPEGQILRSTIESARYSSDLYSARKSRTLSAILVSQEQQTSELDEELEGHTVKCKQSSKTPSSLKFWQILISNMKESPNNSSTSTPTATTPPTARKVAEKSTTYTKEQLYSVEQESLKSASSKESLTDTENTADSTSHQGSGLIEIDLEEQERLRESELRQLTLITGSSKERGKLGRRKTRKSPPTKNKEKYTATPNSKAKARSPKSSPKSAPKTQDVSTTSITANNTKPSSDSSTTLEALQAFSLHPQPPIGFQSSSATVQPNENSTLERTESTQKHRGLVKGFSSEIAELHELRQLLVTNAMTEGSSTHPGFKESSLATNGLSILHSLKVTLLKAIHNFTIDNGIKKEESGLSTLLAIETGESLSYQEYIDLIDSILYLLNDQPSIFDDLLNASSEAAVFLPDNCAPLVKHLPQITQELVTLLPIRLIDEIQTTPESGSSTPLVVSQKHATVCQEALKHTNRQILVIEGNDDTEAHKINTEYETRPPAIPAHLINTSETPLTARLLREIQSTNASDYSPPLVVSQKHASICQEALKHTNRQIIVIEGDNDTEAQHLNESIRSLPERLHTEFLTSDHSRAPKVLIVHKGHKPALENTKKLLAPDTRIIYISTTEDKAVKAQQHINQYITQSPEAFKALPPYLLDALDQQAPYVVISNAVNAAFFTTLARTLDYPATVFLSKTNEEEAASIQALINDNIDTLTSLPNRLITELLSPPSYSKHRVLLIPEEHRLAFTTMHQKLFGKATYSVHFLPTSEAKASRLQGVIDRTHNDIADPEEEQAVRELASSPAFLDDLDPTSDRLIILSETSAARLKDIIPENHPLIVTLPTHLDTPKFRATLQEHTARIQNHPNTGKTHLKLPNTCIQQLTPLLEQLQLSNSVQPLNEARMAIRSISKKFSSLRLHTGMATDLLRREISQSRISSSLLRREEGSQTSIRNRLFGGANRSRTNVTAPDNRPHSSSSLATSTRDTMSTSAKATFPLPTIDEGRHSLHSSSSASIAASKNTSANETTTPKALKHESQASRTSLAQEDSFTIPAELTAKYATAQPTDTNSKATLDKILSNWPKNQETNELLNIEGALESFLDYISDSSNLFDLSMCDRLSDFGKPIYIDPEVHDASFVGILPAPMRNKILLLPSKLSNIFWLDRSTYSLLDTANARPPSLVFIPEQYKSDFQKAMQNQPSTFGASKIIYLPTKLDNATRIQELINQYEEDINDIAELFNTSTPYSDNTEEPLKASSSTNTLTSDEVDNLPNTNKAYSDDTAPIVVLNHAIANELAPYIPSSTCTVIKCYTSSITSEERESLKIYGRSLQAYAKAKEERSHSKSLEKPVIPEKFMKMLTPMITELNLQDDVRSTPTNLTTTQASSDESTARQLTFKSARTNKNHPLLMKRNGDRIHIPRESIATDPLTKNLDATVKLNNLDLANLLIHVTKEVNLADAAIKTHNDPVLRSSMTLVHNLKSRVRLNPFCFTPMQTVPLESNTKKDATYAWRGIVSHSQMSFEQTQPELFNQLNHFHCTDTTKSLYAECAGLHRLQDYLWSECYGRLHELKSLITSEEFAQTNAGKSKVAKEVLELLDTQIKGFEDEDTI